MMPGKMRAIRAAKGFTIVELLIVIVVIAILASISIVAYTGIQARARDSQRLQDIKTIVKVLELYKLQNGTYPEEVSTAGSGGWELTTDGTNPTNFLSALKSGSTGVSKVPLDPKNTATPNLDPSAGNNNYVYYYYHYTAGTGGCAAARGDFYVLGVQRMETVTAGTAHPSSPGFSCAPGTNWNAAGSAWVTGRFVND